MNAEVRDALLLKLRDNQSNAEGFLKSLEKLTPVTSLTKKRVVFYKRLVREWKSLIKQVEGNVK